VDEDLGHAQGVCHQAGVLSGGAAETAQRVFGHIVAALHRDLLDRVGHVPHRDVDEAFGHLFGRAPVARRLADPLRHLGELRPYRPGIEPLVAMRPEHGGKKCRLHLA
jgi:hypothetical protein